MDYLEFFSIFYYFLFLKVTVHPYPVSCQGTPDIFTSWWRHFAYKLLILLKFEFSTPKLLRMQNFRFLVVLVTELVNWITFAPPPLGSCEVILRTNYWFYGKLTCIFEFSSPKLFRMQNSRFLVVVVIELFNWVTFGSPGIVVTSFCIQTIDSMKNWPGYLNSAPQNYSEFTIPDLLWSWFLSYLIGSLLGPLR